MNQNVLKIIHKTMYARAVKYNYNEIPTMLNSLSKTNPSKKEIKEDYSSLVTHFKHPIFIDFVPNYLDLHKNSYKSWINLYSNRNN